MATITPATCGSSGPNSDGKITLTNFGTTDTYDYTLGTTYTGSKTYATATAIPAGGIIASTLPNPATPQTYTVRVFSATCFTDLQVTLNPAICPPPCPLPTGTITAVTATCSGTVASNNAGITITGVTGGDKVGYSAGTTYTGPAYSSATALTGGAYTISSLPNPVGSQTYTVRLFNAANDCYVDKTVIIPEASCSPCKSLVFEIINSDSRDPDSTPGNNIVAEDDQVAGSVCTAPQYIDLELAKSVSPNTGVTCPTGTVFTWTLTLQNKGNMTATNIDVTDVWPGAELLQLSATASKGEFSGGKWSLASLAPNETATLSITTQATKAGSYTNCAYVSAAYPDNDIDSSPSNTQTANEDDDACATITVTGPNPPTISKEFSPMNTKPNVPTRLTLKIWNNEANPITLTQAFVDNLPSSPGQMVVAPTPNVSSPNGLAVVATAGATQFSIPSGTVLPVGLSQISLDVIAPVNGNYCNVIAAGALQTSSCSNVTSETACLLVNDAFVMSPIIKKAFAPQIIQTNQTSTLTITVENRNSVPLTLSEDFSDYLPDGLRASGAAVSSCGTVTVVDNNTTITLLAGSVLQPGSCTISVPVTSTATGTYCNMILMNAMLTQGGGKTNLGNEDRAEACLQVVPSPVFDLALIKTLTAGQSRTVSAGSSVTFTVTVSNQGSVDATNIQVTDYIPTGLTLTDANWVAANGMATLATPIASLSAGQSTTRNIVFTVLPTAAGSVTNVTEISSAGNAQNVQDKDSTPDNDPNNDGTPINDSTSGDRKNNPSQDEDDSDPEEITVTPLLACLGDYVWFDANQNGQQDAGETGVASVTAVLYNATTNLPLSTTLTDATGKYLFCGLNPGQYYVRFTAPSGMTFTTANTGNDGTDSDAGTNGQTGVYSLTAGQTDLTVDAGLIIVCQPANYTLCGAGSSLTLVAGVATGNVQWYKDGVAIAGATSLTYIVTQAGVYSYTGADASSCSVSLCCTVSVTLCQLACLGDYVWLDTNQNGQQDSGETGVASVTVVLYDATTNLPLSTTVTDGTGRYRFCNLNPGQYYVRFTPPAGMTYTTPNTGPDGTDSDAGPTGQTPVYSLTAGQDEPTVDAGLVPLKACLGDYVWYDNNKNGQQDPGEPPAVGVTATLYDATTNQPLSTTVTDAMGKYLFCNLNPGTYYVVFTAPSGSTFTTANTGNDTTDSDAGVGGKTGNYTLVAGQTDLTVDAGLIPKCTSPNCGEIGVQQKAP